MVSSNILPIDPKEFKTQEYWENVYKKDDENTTYDWFIKYDKLKLLFNKHIKDKNSSILILGCGNSTHGEDMYRDGYKNIVNIDFSETVIKNMKERCYNMPEMKWIKMNIKDLKFDNESFDVVIDKGTMDSLMSDNGYIIDPSNELAKEIYYEIKKYKEFFVLMVFFLHITMSDPIFKEPHLKRDCWEIKTTTINDDFHYFFYSMVKKISY